MAMMRRNFRTYAGRPWWVWRSIANRRKRGANQFPSGSPIPTGSTIISMSPDAVAGSNIVVQQLNGFTNNPTKREWQWMRNNVAFGARLTTAPTGLSNVSAGSWKLVSYAENASNPGNPNYANSNTLAVAAVDTTPNAFAFADQTNVPRSTAIASEPITVAGINRPAAISVTGGEYSKNGGPFTSTSGTVVAGDAVRARNTSSSAFSTAVNTVVTIGGVSDTFTTTTAAEVVGDTTPDQFSFVDVTGADPGVSQVSNSITVTGIDAPTYARVSVAEFRVNNGPWTFSGTDLTVVNGDTVTLRRTSPSNGGASSDMIVSIGGVIDTWTITTKVLAPAAMAAPGLSSTASSIAVTRAADPASGGSAITDYDLQYRTGGGTWTIVAMGTNPQTIASLLASTAYEVQTRANNAVGKGAWGATATISTQAAAGGFNPATLGPSMWIDASDAATLSIVDGKVVQASDKSGNGRHVSQETAANQPNYTASHAVANNKPAFFASATAQCLRQPQGQTTPIEEVYIVAAFSTGVETVFNRTNGGDFAAGEGYFTLISGGGSNGLPRQMGNVNTAHFIGTSALSSTGVFRNRDTTQSGSGSGAAILPLPLSVLRIPRNASVVDTLRVIMGQYTSVTSSNRAWSGPFCEVIAFPAALSVADRTSLVDYLIAKWGIVV